MPDFLLELFSEEIPARMQARAAADLLAAILAELGTVKPAASRSFYAMQRIGLVLEGLPVSSAGRVLENRGPRVGSPEAAIAGFLRGAGLSSIEACEIRDTGKGSFYFAVRTEPGQTIQAVLAEAIPAVLDRFVWPKSMRWAGYGVRWVRPLRNILAILYGDGASETVPIRWRLGGAAALDASNVTYGHRFLAPSRIVVESWDDYRQALERRFVLLDPLARRSKILVEGERLAGAVGCHVRTDEALLEEVVGLAEWPVVRLGRIEPRFMALPTEVLTTSMRAHQKYFACGEATGALAPYFVVVANNEAPDGGAAIVRGNERVLRARLSDAAFFWDLDRQQRLETRIDRLKERVFHAKLGSVHDKVMRMTALSRILAASVPGADPVLADRVVRLAKADLSSALVGEFPELQGVMGRYLALHDGEAPEVADAIARHYAPLGAGDPAPTAPLDIVAALADKLDTLAGFFAIGETPTGSKDPYALRRAALGVIRIVLENGLRLGLRAVFSEALRLLVPQLGAKAKPDTVVIDELMAFFADRLNVALREEGVRHDLITATFALGGEDDLVRLVARTKALQTFILSDDGANLLTAYRRASKIVGIEEKRDDRLYRDPPDPAQLEAPEEIQLAETLSTVARDAQKRLVEEDFTGAMAALARLRLPVDEFFERVTVNADRPALRQNRLRLLAQIWQALDEVADFSKIEG